MKIGIIATYTTDHILGGREIHIAQLAKKLVEKGHKVVIITGKCGKKKVVVKNGIKTYYFDKSLRPIFYSEKFFDDFFSFVKNISIKEKIDIIHNQNSASYGVRKILQNVPMIVTLHGTPINEIKASLKNFSWKTIPAIAIQLRDYLFIKKIISKSKRIVSISPHLKEDLLNQYNLPFKKILVIPNGVNTKVFSKKNYVKNKGTCSFLYVGSLIRKKGVQLLIKSLSRIPNGWELVIIGDGNFRSRLESLVNALNLKDKIRFVGRVENSELPKYYSMSDVFVMPTLFVETFPYVILESMSCELPVIASNIGGIPSMIDSGKTGFLFEQGDMGTLTKFLMLAMKDVSLRKRVGLAARKKILKNFDENVMIKLIIKEYKDIILKP